jgi:hypothetical protein
MLDKIIPFFNQDEEHEAFITGGPGTGKTTNLKSIVEYLIKQRTTFQVVAYTHKAKEVLEKKLPKGTPISTLHSWLKKRPSVNSKAKSMNSLLVSNQFGEPERLQVLIVDEFSFINEEDYLSIGELQDELYLRRCSNCDLDPDNCGCNTETYLLPRLRVLYVGDPNQLPPVKGFQAISAGGLYHVHLTHNYRSGEGLQPTIKALEKMIERGVIEPLVETEYFKRNQDIVKLYKEDSTTKMLLAYTNKRVQELNAEIQGYKQPKPGDLIYNTTLRKTLTFTRELEPYEVKSIEIPGGKLLQWDAKYKQLEFLNQLNYVKFYDVEDYLHTFQIACIFGFYENKLIRDELGSTLVQLNKQGTDSKKAYREYKTVNDCVCVVDFDHCLTVHKSQGQEFDNIYLDMDDLSICPNTDTILRLALVAISRARDKVYTI